MRKLALIFVACIVALGAHAATRGENTVNRDTAATTQARGATTVPRTATVQSRAAAPSIVSRSAAPATQSRTVVAPRTATTPRTNTVRAATSARTATPARRATNPISHARAATFATPTIHIAPTPTGTVDDYATCRKVFYDCMDEFCATKDTQLKRCACSSRSGEFDSVKRQMSRVEDQFLEFSERLLTVNLDAEDAAAISIATEGETAYQQDDESESKKILDEIAEKLRANTSALDAGRDLSALMIPIDVSTAFDNVDLFSGITTTTKSGTALYGAALPVCREMVREVCNPEAASIAESGYEMLVEQDCLVVSKAYETMRDQALAKVRDGHALLEMSRLDAHQRRNADDILTCKAKMLETLTNTNVCGDNLGKCLDITGKYIDPSTGTAFLDRDDIDLRELDNLITRPSGNEHWVNAGNGNNKRFVDYLKTRRNYLESAMDACQDISDMVWEEFLEDALAQIKLAQEAKLEQVRQSCTTLTTTCLTDTADSITDFDARALSIFGVMADKTVNGMCSRIMTACNAMMDDTGWVGGMSDIATDKTYDTILSTCAEVGKACVIRTCTSINGNFGLCKFNNATGKDDVIIGGSAVRASILERRVCWSEVRNCVASAGTDKIAQIMTRQGKTPNANNNFYNQMYETAPNDKPCANCTDADDCATCMITERIWGNCDLPYNQSQSLIKEPLDRIDTLLWWFAINTGAAEEIEGTCTGPASNASATCEPACPEHQRCIRGQCVDIPTGGSGGGNDDECTDNSDCSSDQVCTNGSCVSAPVVGGCTGHTQCPGDNNGCFNGECTECGSGDVYSKSANSCISNPCTGNNYWNITRDACQACQYSYFATEDHLNCEQPICESNQTLNYITGQCDTVSCPAPGRMFSIHASMGLRNCCPTGLIDKQGNCCAQAVGDYRICVPRSDSTVVPMTSGYEAAVNHWAGGRILFAMYCVDGVYTPSANPTQFDPGTCSGITVVFTPGGKDGMYLSGIASQSFTLADGTVCTADYQDTLYFQPADKCGNVLVDRYELNSIVSY